MLHTTLKLKSLSKRPLMAPKIGDGEEHFTSARNLIQIGRQADVSNVLGSRKDRIKLNVLFWVLFWFGYCNARICSDAELLCVFVCLFLIIILAIQVVFFFVSCLFTFLVFLKNELFFLLICRSFLYFMGGICQLYLL